MKKDKRLSMLLLFLMLLFPGCSSSRYRGRVCYLSCEHHGTVESVRYVNGQSCPRSIMTNSSVATIFQRNALGELELELVCCLRGEGCPPTEVLTRNIQLYDDEGDEIARYSPDEALALLVRRKLNATAGLESQARRAGYGHSYGQTQYQGSVYGPHEQWRYAGDAYGQTQTYDPRAAEMARGRLAGEEIRLSGLYNKLIERRHGELLRNEIISSGEIKYGTVFFDEDDALEWVLALVRVGNDEHVFVFRRDYESSCLPDDDIDPRIAAKLQRRPTAREVLFPKKREGRPTMPEALGKKYHEPNN